MTTQMIVKIDPDLKKKVSTLAKSEGKSTSEVVRELLVEYIRTRDIGPYIDDLWKSIGRDLQAKGVNQAKIDTDIKNLRAGN